MASTLLGGACTSGGPRQPWAARPAPLARPKHLVTPRHASVCACLSVALLHTSHAAAPREHSSPCMRQMAPSRASWRAARRGARDLIHVPREAVAYEAEARAAEAGEEALRREVGDAAALVAPTPLADAPRDLSAVADQESKPVEPARQRREQRTSHRKRKRRQAHRTHGRVPRAVLPFVDRPLCVEALTEAVEVCVRRLRGDPTRTDERHSPTQAAINEPTSLSSSHAPAPPPQALARAGRGCALRSAASRAV
jgi:hypothetical protein